MASDREKTEVLTRLRRVEGQIRGIQRMVEEDRDCEAIATQLLAARSALDKASLYIMSHQIEDCLLDPAERGNRRRLQRVISFFLRFADAPPDTLDDSADSLRGAADSLCGAGEKTEEKGTLPE